MEKWPYLLSSFLEYEEILDKMEMEPMDSDNGTDRAEDEVKMLKNKLKTG